MSDADECIPADYVWSDNAKLNASINRILHAGMPYLNSDGNYRLRNIKTWAELAALTPKELQRTQRLGKPGCEAILVHASKHEAHAFGIQVERTPVGILIAFRGEKPLELKPTAAAYLAKRLAQVERNG